MLESESVGKTAAPSVRKIFGKVVEKVLDQALDAVLDPTEDLALLYPEEERSPHW